MDRMENKMQDSKRSPESFTLEEVISSTRDLEKMMKNYGWNDCPMCGYNPKRLADFLDFIDSEISKAREEGDIASDFLYWHPLGGGMPDSSIRIGVEFEVGGCYEDWGFVIEQNGRTISSGRTLKEAISKLKDSK